VFDDSVSQARQEIEYISSDLSFFYDFVNIYENKKGIDQIMGVVESTAQWTGSKEQVQKLIKTLSDKKVIEVINLYQDKKSINDIARSIAWSAQHAQSKKITMTITKTLKKYINSKAASEVGRALGNAVYCKKSKEATAKTAITLETYLGTDAENAVVNALASASPKTRSGDALIKISETLNKYINKEKEAKEIAQSIYLVSEKTKSEPHILDICELFNHKDLNSTSIKNIASLYRLIGNLSDKYDEKIKKNISSKLQKYIKIKYQQLSNTSKEVFNKEVRKYISTIRNKIHENPDKFYKVMNSA